MNIDNLIVIKGGAYNDVKAVLKQWIDLYSKDLQEGLVFRLYKNGRGEHIIQADSILDNERFFYLLNYLKYPEGVEYKVDVEGFATGKDENRLKGKELLVYVSANDDEYDNVYIATSENENFKVDFSGGIIEVVEEKKYDYPSDLMLGESEKLMVQKRQNNDGKLEVKTNKLTKRFWIGAALLFSAFALVFLVYRESLNFMMLNAIIAFAVWVWLMMDYEILQENKLYLMLLGLGLAVLAYGHWLNIHYAYKDKSSLVLIGTSMPILLLMVQRPLRFVFVKIMKRVPKVEKPAPSFADFIYMVLLWSISMLLPVLYYVN